MKKKLIEVAVLGAFLLAITAPITKPVWSQLAPIRGESSPGVYENLKSDVSGRLLTATSGPNAAISYTFSSVQASAVTTTLVNANTSRKVILIQNNNTVSNLLVGATSPVSATNSMNLVPGASLFVTSNAPTNALYGWGTTSTVQVTIAEGQ